jgi:hypothetical protein
MGLPWHDDSLHSPFFALCPMGRSNIKRLLVDLSTVTHPVHESQVAGAPTR